MALKDLQNGSRQSLLLSKKWSSKSSQGNKIEIYCPGIFSFVITYLSNIQAMPSIGHTGFAYGAHPVHFHGFYSCQTSCGWCHRTKHHEHSELANGTPHQLSMAYKALIRIAFQEIVFFFSKSPMRNTNSF